jgi:hypothetical protein
VKTGWKRGFGIVAISVAALLVAGGAVAIASHGKGVRRHAVKRLVRTGVHADVSLVRANGTADSFSVDRGKVTGESPTSLTLERLDGTAVTLTLNGNTAVRGTITSGRQALAFSRGGVAFRILAPGFRLVPLVPVLGPKSPIVHLQVDFVRADGSTGSVTLDRGRVTAESSTSLTIERRDGKSVSFTIAAGAIVRGKLVDGGHALVFSRSGTAFRILARAA